MERELFRVFDVVGGLGDGEWRLEGEREFLGLFWVVVVDEERDKRNEKMGFF